MKDLLRDFNFQKTLKHLSEECLDALLISKASVDKDLIAQIRKAKKTKAAQIEALAAMIDNNPQCIRILRVAHFFHKNRSAFTGLRSYFEGKNTVVDWDGIGKGKSEVDQIVLLYMQHESPLTEYFTLCLYTHQSKSYCSCRSDYVNADHDEPITEENLAQLGEQLLEAMKKERASRYCGKRTFQHDGKVFLLLEFDDLPTHQREYEDGKDKPEDKYRRLAMDLAYVFDKKNKTVEVIAETSELRLVMHRTSAAVLYGTHDIVARPPKNEIFDLEKLLKYVLDGTPLTVSKTKSSVTQAFVNELRISRSQPPFWEASIKLKIPANRAESGRDWVVDAQNAAKSFINTKEQQGGWWHKTYIHATHAELL